jgi:hypothetical protein
MDGKDWECGVGGLPARLMRFRPDGSETSPAQRYQIMACATVNGDQDEKTSSLGVLDMKLVFLAFIGLSSALALQKPVLPGDSAVSSAEGQWLQLLQQTTSSTIRALGGHHAFEESTSAVAATT